MSMQACLQDRVNEAELSAAALWSTLEARACYACMDVIKGTSLFSELEPAISAANMAHECQGFLRGYEYCLTMLNLSKELEACNGKR